MRNFTIAILSLGIVIMILTNEVLAQLNYQTGGFSTTSGTYTDLGTNGSAVIMSNIDNGLSAPQPIGFTFRFNGTDYDSFVMYVDGFIKLGRDTASGNLLYTTFAQPPAGGPFSSAIGRDSNLIVPFGQDLWNRGGAQVPEFRVHTSGSPGSQVCTIQWKNVSDKLQNGVDSQYDTINFQLKLYETSNWIEFQYGRWVSSTNTSNARFGAVGLKGSNNLNTQLITLTKASAIAWSNVIVNAGNYTTNALNYGNAVGISRPAPDIGRIYRFTPVVFNDLAVSNVYAVGKLISNASLTDSIRAYITNPGVNAQSSITVTLTISGANTFSATTTIPSLAANAGVYVAFPPFIPVNNGTNLITVSVPSDDNASNNSGSYGLSASNSFLSYNDTLQSPGQSYGHSTWVQFWGTRFRITDKRRITSVRSFIFSNSGATGDTIRGMVLDTNGNVIGLSAPFVIQPSNLGTWVTLPLTIPVEINNRSFISGIACQSASVNRFLGSIQNESPIRPNNTAFYSIANTTTAVSAFTTGMSFGFPGIFGLGRLMMECSAEPIPANDMGIVAVYPLNQLRVPTGQAIPLRAIVKNFGSATQLAGVSVRYSINNGPPVSPVSTSIALNEDDTLSVVFSGLSALNFSTPGTYSIKVWSQLGTDAARFNDTFTVQIEAVSGGFNLPYRVATNLPSNNWLTTQNQNNVMKQTATIHPNGAVLNNTLHFDNYFTFGTAQIISPMLNFSGQTNPGLHFYIAHGPNTVSTVSDTLQVLVSTNGGYTYDIVYNKNSQGPGPRLGTDTASALAYFPNVVEDWRQEYVDLSAYANLPNVIVGFRNVSQTSNGVFITSIGVTNAANQQSSVITSSGTTSSGAINVLLVSTGATNGVLSIATYNGFPTSSASPVFAPNSSATTGNSSVFTPNLVGNRMWALSYSGIGTNNFPQSIPIQILIDYATLPGINVGDSVYIMRRYDIHSSWIALPTSRSTTVLTSSVINGLGEFALGSLSSSSNTLPVIFSSIKATRKSSDIDIHWQTASEINNAYFEVERSFDNEVFTPIARIKSHSPNSTVRLNYTYTDKNMPHQAYYRIKQVDLDGSHNQSNTVSVNAVTEMPSVHPNPFTDDLYISFNKTVGTASITIRDMQGKIVNQMVVHAGDQDATIHTVDLSPGFYFIEVTGASGTFMYKMCKRY